MVTLTKVPAVPEAKNFAWDILSPSLNHGKIGESHCQSLGRFMERRVDKELCFNATDTQTCDGDNVQVE